MSAPLNVTLAAGLWARRTPEELTALVTDLDARSVTSVLLEDPASVRPVPGAPWRWDTASAVAHLARTTTRIGLVTTVATTFTDPWTASRLVGTLDHFADGRVGWLVDAGDDAVRTARTRTVSPVHVEGRPRERALELVAVSRGLWDGWGEGAFLADKERGDLVDESLIAPAEPVGPHFHVPGPSTLRRPPSGNPPVLVRVRGTSDEELLPAADVVVAHASSPTDLDRLRTATLPERRARVLVAVRDEPPTDGTGQAELAAALALVSAGTADGLDVRLHSDVAAELRPVLAVLDPTPASGHLRASYALTPARN